MKKIISILMGMVLLFNLFAIGGSATSTEVESFEEYKKVCKSIKEIIVDDIEIVYKADAMLISDTVWDEKLQDYVFTPEYYCHCYEVEDFTIVYEDSSRELYSESEWHNSDYYLSYYDDQSYENQWDIGTHKATLCFYEYEADFNVVIKENPIEKIVVDDIELYEYADTFWNRDVDWNVETDEEIWTPEYRYYLFEVNDFEIVYADGNSERYIESDWYDSNYYPEVIDKQSYENQWSVGVHKVDVSFMGVETQINVTVKENPIKEIKVEDIELLEGTDGIFLTEKYYDEKEDIFKVSPEYFYYNCYINDFDIVYKAGTSEKYTESDLYGLDYYPEIVDEQGYQNQWGVGTHKVTVTYMGIETQIDVTVKESPVKDIIVPDFELYQGADSYETSDYYWDEKTQEERYTPAYDQYSFYPDDFKIVYKDGSSEMYKDSKWSTEYCCVSVDSDQSYENQWGIGTYKATVFFMGVEKEVNVTIKENPVKSIEVEDVCLKEGVDCHPEPYYCCGDSEATYNFYEFEPQKVTVNFKDGTSVTGSMSDLNDATGYSAFYYINDGQIPMDEWKAGTYKCTFNFMGIDTEYNVVIEK